jgi:hypothetical protein
MRLMVTGGFGGAPNQLRTSSSPASRPQSTEYQRLDRSGESDPSKLLILWILRGWLAALDDFRNWLIREAA